MCCCRILQLDVTGLKVGQQLRDLFFTCWENDAVQQQSYNDAYRDNRMKWCGSRCYLKADDKEGFASPGDLKETTPLGCLRAPMISGGAP